ncbi:hypothetical protein [Phenylobacterium sp. SCN 70-31]|uniref:hypothetical protein n=1 Tax=Phenylobacterium sp. SCN 70-31 TaxID=1660129 RepID=UPI0025FBDC5F|nr:hypothetical protein [Phenylobacterium sp. SCN 70-31]
MASLLALISAGCASLPPAPDGLAVVSIIDLSAHPDRWDGQRVQVTGLVVAEFENLGLYSSWRDYCSSQSRAHAIHVDWDKQSEFHSSRQRRMATLRGTFRNLVGVRRAGVEGAEITISTGAPGPGPLEDVEMIQWHGPQLPRCGL